METKHPALANDSRLFPAFLHTYRASGVLKKVQQGRDIHRYMDHTREWEPLESKG